ncbi:MAG TPA: 4-(cytidine 5'-diphospho)-2-C-methyl-D-erythritol kinase [Alphaproteobacteria bacterium]|nr:4-(cytidine 5'-diphospho)-2-C-methyl-D-erythritol kinase [Alphaproteobacteria bacterium]
MAPSARPDVGGPLPPGEREPSPAIAEPAPAKINLYLHVVGRRPDGYHLLDSLVAFADVGDCVSVTPADRLSLSVDGPFAGLVPAGGDNLAFRAAEALGRAVGRAPEIAIQLTKELPVAAGVGGGSADAAAVLRALARLWRLGRKPVLAEVAERLGADVPACLAGRTAFAGGIGERLDPAPSVAGIPVVLVNPGIAAATPEVFRARIGGFSSPGRFRAADGCPAALARLLSERRNDLAEPACRLFPEIEPTLAALAAAEGCLLARMSGSGATCFGLFPSPEAAAAAAAALGGAEPGWWVRAGRLL